MTLFKELESLEWVIDPEGRRCCRPNMTGRCRDKDGNVWFICNGRAIQQGGPRGHEHVYICAKSKKDACQLMDDWYKKLFKTKSSPGVGRWAHEINAYYSKGCWGNRLDDTVVERGLWVQWKHTDKIVEKVL